MSEQDDEDKFVAGVIEELEINKDNIFHFIILGGVEVVGEVFAEDDNSYDGENHAEDYMLVNPMKVLRENWVSDDGVESNHYFVDWNPCSEGPYTTINPEMIVSMSHPNKKTLNSYIMTVYDYYFPIKITLSDDLLDDSNMPTGHLLEDGSDNKSNVIDFMSKLKEKQSRSSDR